MSIYPAPISILPIFNSEIFISKDENLSLEDADEIYLSKIEPDGTIGPLRIQSRVLLGNGSSLIPSQSFIGNSQTGLFKFTGTVPNNDFYLKVQGSDCCAFQPQGIRLFGDLSGNNALYAATILTSYAETTINVTYRYDPDQGIYFNGTVRLIKIGRYMQWTPQEIVTMASPPNNTKTVDLSLGPIPPYFRPSSLAHGGCNIIKVLEDGTNLVNWTTSYTPSKIRLTRTSQLLQKKTLDINRYTMNLMANY